MPPPPARAAVFQYLGSTIDSPGVIGIVEAGGIWTTLDLETEELWFSDTRRRVRYRELSAGSAERARADRLVNEWARQRWLAR